MEANRKFKDVCSWRAILQWLADVVSGKGCAKPHVQSFDFRSRTACQYAGREGLFFWTIVAMPGFRTHLEHTPTWHPSPEFRLPLCEIRKTQVGIGAGKPYWTDGAERSAVSQARRVPWR